MSHLSPTMRAGRKDSLAPDFSFCGQHSFGCAGRNVGARRGCRIVIDGMMGLMRVIHVVPAITEEASGPSYSVVRLCESLIGTGVDVQLAALDWSSAPVSLPYLKTFPLGIGPRRLGVSPSDAAVARSGS